MPTKSNGPMRAARSIYADIYGVEAAATDFPPRGNKWADIIRHETGYDAARELAQAIVDNADYLHGNLDPAVDLAHKVLRLMGEDSA